MVFLLFVWKTCNEKTCAEKLVYGLNIENIIGTVIALDSYGSIVFRLIDKERNGITVSRKGYI